MLSRRRRSGIRLTRSRRHVVYPASVHRVVCCCLMSVCVHSHIAVTRVARLDHLISPSGSQCRASCIAQAAEAAAAKRQPPESKRAVGRPRVRISGVDDAVDALDAAAVAPGTPIGLFADTQSDAVEPPPTMMEPPPTAPLLRASTQVVVSIATPLCALHVYFEQHHSHA